MLFSSLFALSALAATSLASPVLEEKQDSGIYGLSIGGGRFDINYLQTFRVSYANTSAYLGEIKYQSYSEPLVASGSDGISFLSIHQSPTGFQSLYVVPHQTQPVGFSVPHGGAPPGVSTTGFSFDRQGNLNHNGVNLFYACQNAELASINSYQIWWVAGGQPNGVQCKGPLGIKKSDACSRF